MDLWYCNIDDNEKADKLAKKFIKHTCYDLEHLNPLRHKRTIQDN